MKKKKLKQTNASVHKVVWRSFMQSALVTNISVLTTMSVVCPVDPLTFCLVHVFIVVSIPAVSDADVEGRLCY